MKVLLDTHFLVWLSTGGRNVRVAERAVIEDGENDILLSAASIWELRIKWAQQGRRRSIDGLADPASALVFAEEAGIVVLPLLPTDCAASLEVPIRHRDPFDEMLLIHTQQIGARLLTRDRALLAHPLALQL